MYLMNLDKNEDAIKELKLTIIFSPDFPPAYNELSLISLDSGNFSEALKNLKKALEIDSTYSIAYYNMGHILANMGKYNEASSAYKNYLIYAHNPEDSLSVKTKINILSAKEK
jgi:tetratricopeptide (TPR) repeat protein